MPPQSQSNCPPGTRFRKGHTRKFKQLSFTAQGQGKLQKRKQHKEQAYVPGACVHPKQTRKLNTNGLKKGELLKYGYSFRLPDKQRHSALKKAIKTLGASYVYRVLEQGAKISKNVHSDAHLKFVLDMGFIKNQIKQ